MAVAQQEQPLDNSKDNPDNPVEQPDDASDAHLDTLTHKSNSKQPVNQFLKAANRSAMPASQDGAGTLTRSPGARLADSLSVPASQEGVPVISNQSSGKWPETLNSTLASPGGVDNGVMSRSQEVTPMQGPADEEQQSRLDGEVEESIAQELNDSGSDEEATLWPELPLASACF